MKTYGIKQALGVSKKLKMSFGGSSQASLCWVRIGLVLILLTVVKFRVLLSVNVSNAEGAWPSFRRVRSKNVLHCCVAGYFQHVQIIYILHSKNCAKSERF